MISNLAGTGKKTRHTVGHRQAAKYHYICMGTQLHYLGAKWGADTLWQLFGKLWTKIKRQAQEPSSKMHTNALLNPHGVCTFFVSFLGAPNTPSCYSINQPRSMFCQDAVFQPREVDVWDDKMIDQQQRTLKSSSILLIIIYLCNYYYVIIIYSYFYYYILLLWILWECNLWWRMIIIWYVKS